MADTRDLADQDYASGHLTEFWRSRVEALLDVLEGYERVAAGAGDPSLTAIEWQAVMDALLFTENHAAIVSDAHGRAHVKVDAFLDRLGAGDRPPAPSEAEMMPRVMALVGGVLMLCDEIERTAPGLPTIDGKRLRVMAEEVRDAWPAVCPAPRAGPSAAAIDAALMAAKEQGSVVSGMGVLVPDVRAALFAAYAVDFGNAGAASPAAAPPQEGQ